MNRDGPPGRPPSPFLVLVLGVAATALTAEWLRFQEGWTLAAVPAALGAITTLAAVARSYRVRRAWRRAREAAAGEAVPPAPEVEDPPARVQARAPREQPTPSVLRHDVPTSLLGPSDLDAGPAEDRDERRADGRADRSPGRTTPARPARRPGARDRVETD